MIPKFNNYSRQEAKDIGVAFLKTFTQHGKKLGDATSTHDWTEDILDSFAATAPASGVVVDASRAKARKAEDPPPAIAPARVSWGEFMLDLVHHRFLAYGRVHEYGTLEYWRAAYAPNREPEMLLALESEAGKQGNRPGNMVAVLEDASKLVSLAARLKVVVFGSNDLEERRNMQSIAKLMQAQDYTNQRSGAERPTWLWLDLPWSVWTPARGPNGWVGTAGSNDVEELDLQ